MGLGGVSGDPDSSLWGTGGVSSTGRTRDPNPDCTRPQRAGEGDEGRPLVSRYSEDPRKLTSPPSVGDVETHLRFSGARPFAPPSPLPSPGTILGFGGTSGKKVEVEGGIRLLTDNYNTSDCTVRHRIGLGT